MLARAQRVLVPAAVATSAAWLAAATLVVASASADVTIQPTQVAPGDFTRLDVRVPNERNDAGTTKVEVQFPAGFIFVSTEPVPGWTAEITKRKLAKPVEAFGEQQTEEVDAVTWTGDGKTGIVKPGEFVDFGLSVGMPDAPGETLTFKALQTYAGGEVVRWIGPPDSEEPAPQVVLTSIATTAEPGEAATEDDDGAPVWLVVVALALGALGLLAGAAALVRSRG